MIYLDKKQLLNKVIFHLVLTLIVAGVAAILSADIPIGLFIGALVIEIILFIILLFYRKKGSLGYIFLYLFALFSGITMGYAIDHYVTILGGIVVVYAFLGTATIFAVMAKLGWDPNKNLLSWGKWLLIAMVILVVALLLNVFFIQSAILSLLVGLFGILIFSASIMYELNVILKVDHYEEDIPNLVLGLYLDFVNLFLSILRVLGFISSTDD